MEIETLYIMEGKERRREKNPHLLSYYPVDFRNVIRCFHVCGLSAVKVSNPSGDTVLYPNALTFSNKVSLSTLSDGQSNETCSTASVWLHDAH